MGKYDPLKRHLKRQKHDQVEMSFAEIERILYALLPNGAQRQEWWANDPDPKHIQREAWRSAGFEAALAGKERVRFQRLRAH